MDETQVLWPSPHLPVFDLALAQSRIRAWFHKRFRHRRAALATKRLLDVVLAGLLLVLCAPLLALAILGVRWSSPGSALFVQRRIGYLCQEFNMYKLRTMVDGADELESRLDRRETGEIFFKPEDDPRVTWIGRLLRKASIDELPQLWNVLRGDMSLVGPRPLLLRDFHKFPKQGQLRRFSLKPGITGLWQVSGRSACDDRRRLELDLEYVDQWSLWLDLKILARTVPVVLSGRGAY